VTLAALRDAGAPDLLRDAALLVEERGLAKGVVHNPKTGEVDAFGALCLAAGSKVKHLKLDDVVACKVPPVNQGLVLGCVDALEAQFGDLPVWSDGSTSIGVAREFRRLADRLCIVV
jgi:hypothetical protein